SQEGGNWSSFFCTASMGIAPVNAWVRDFTGRGEVYAQGNSFCITVGSHYGLAGIRSRAVSIVGISSGFQSIPNLKKLTRKANSGDAAAQFKLGHAYHFGLGVDKNVYQAIQWYRKAANYGDPAAQNNLGYIYETGPEAVKDLQEAVKWYMRAAVSGSPEAALNLGLSYRYGKGVNKSSDDARRWIARAAAADCPDALAALAYLYAVGQGVSQDSQ